MKNNFTKRLLTLVMAFAIVFTPTVNAFANTPDVVTNGVEEQSINSVLAEAEPIASTDGEILKDKLVDSSTVTSISTNVLDIETQNELKNLGVPVEDVKKADVMEDVVNYTGETYTKYIVDNDHYVCVDTDNQITNIVNAGEDILAPTWDDEFDTTESQYLATGQQTLEMLGMDSSYELVKSEEQTVDFWFLAYRKSLDNGLVNNGDGVNILVARKDASVGVLTRFDMVANTLEAEISEAEAIAKAQPIINDLNANVDGAELRYIQPNYYWKADGPYEPADFVRLAYEISLNDEQYLIDVDAITGEVIGGGEAMGSGGAFGDQYVSGAQTVVSDAKKAIGTTMGYSPIYSLCASNDATKSNILTFIKRSDARAFYFSGHGYVDPTYGPRISVKNTGGVVVWRLYTKDIGSYHTNWNFVFLSTCHLGKASVASHFNISDSSDSKAFMGFADEIISTTCSKFNSIFWSQVGHSRLYNCALVARNAIYDMKLDAPLFFAGDRKYMGGVLGKDPNV